jgi:hypothetical protein
MKKTWAEADRRRRKKRLHIPSGEEDSPDDTTISPSPLERSFRSPLTVTGSTLIWLPQGQKFTLIWLPFHADLVT